jgi:hypothetical protein
MHRIKEYLARLFSGSSLTSLNLTLKRQRRVKKPWLWIETYDPKKKHYRFLEITCPPEADKLLAQLAPLLKFGEYDKGVYSLSRSAAQRLIKQGGVTYRIAYAPGEWWKKVALDTELPKGQPFWLWYGKRYDQCRLFMIPLENQHLRMWNWIWYEDYEREQRKQRTQQYE